MKHRLLCTGCGWLLVTSRPVKRCPLCRHILVKQEPE
jgi:hypothetical protein